MGSANGVTHQIDGLVGEERTIVTQHLGGFNFTSLRVTRSSPTHPTHSSPYESLEYPQITKSRLKAAFSN